MAKSIIIHNRPIGKPRSRIIGDACMLLAAETRRAQKLLNAEADRVRKETAAREAFSIPAGLLCSVLQAACPGAGPGEFQDAYGKMVEVFEAEGWTVLHHASALRSTESREPLRKLSDLLESPFGHFRTTLNALLAAIDDLHGNMVVNERRSYNNRIPAPVIAYSLPGKDGAA